MIGEMLSLTHLFTKEIVSVPVELVTRTYVSIRWGQSGIYDLNLKDNVLTARSMKTKMRHKMRPNWVATDIAAVRKMAQDYMDGEDKKAEIRRLSEVHRANMPGVKKLG